MVCVPCHGRDRAERRLKITAGRKPGFLFTIYRTETLHIYIDETGDTGFKLDKGSSKIFAITLIIFKDPKEIEKTVKAIRNMEERIRYPEKAEWHFSKVKPTWRKEFLKALLPYDFEIRTVIMNKENIEGPKLTTDKRHFYNYTCKLVLQYSLHTFNEAKIVFDKCGNKEFYTEMRQYLRNKCNMDHNSIKSIKSKDSHKEIPLQIADMVAGAIGRRFTEKKDRDDYYNIIKSKVKDYFVFPDDIK